MHKQQFIGKTIEEAKENALKELNILGNEVIFIEVEEKKSLFSKKAEVEVITKKEINDYIKGLLNTIVTDMGIENNIETKTRDEVLIFNIIGNKNEVLIGKQGRTIDALQNIATQAVKNEINEFYRFQVDVADYKFNKQKRLEKIAKYTAKDVARTGCSVKLDPMNAYERRIVHNALTDSKDIYTESVGEEPNRCVVIKPKED